MKFSTVVATSVVAATAIAQDVACRVNGVQQSVVDLDTGVCPFTIPSSLPVNFRYASDEDYLVDAYYTEVQSGKIFNDIAGAGRVIEIPAKDLYNAAAAALFHVHLEESPASNSTAALRKRFQIETEKRDEADIVAKVEAATGTAVPSSELTFDVTDPDTSSSSAPGSGSTTESESASGSATASGSDVTSTVTGVSSTIVTITSCSDHKCTETTAPATWGVTTETKADTTIIYSTWCPVVTKTELSTTLVTITSCSDNKCHETTAPATWGETTETKKGGETTVYSTWCPVTTTEVASTTVVTITSCADNKCHETTAPATWGETTETKGGETTVYSTWCPVPSTATETVSTTVVTVTSCSDNKCHETTAPATWGETTETKGGETTVYSTWCPVTSTEVTTGPSNPETTAPVVTLSTVTSAGTSSAPAVTTAFGGAAKVGGSLLALVAIPAAYLL
ncbi:hypothetical protein E0198_000862 [Clavispora lusitaniae]|nr:hypothetical protein E0198_000862 [Clavispora lusitaniae]